MTTAADEFNPFRKTYHKASKVNAKGEVSAVCYPTPRPIPDNERWTIRDEAVTCGKCKRILEAKKLYERIAR